MLVIAEVEYTEAEPRNNLGPESRKDTSKMQKELRLKEFLVTPSEGTVKTFKRLPVSATLVMGFIQQEDAFIYFLTLDAEVGNPTSEFKE
jgi:hypothetical protein